MTKIITHRFGLPLAVFAAALLIYSLTLTQVHTFDAYSYAAAVQTKPWRETFHPHHLAYGPVGALAYGGARWLGYDGMALLPLQLVNVLAGAAGVAWWVAILRRISGRADVALLGGGLLGAAYAWWYYAVEVEVYTLAALLLLGGCAVLLRLLHQPLHGRDWLWLGGLHSGAILFHQTNVLWTLPVLVGWRLAAWPATTSISQRWRLLGRYIAVNMLVVGGAYGAVMASSGFRSWAQVRAWLFEYAATGFWGGPISGETVRRLLDGWRFTLAGVGGGLMLLVLAGLIVAVARPLMQRWRRETLVALAWIGSYTLFFGWWEADNIEFWIATLPPLTLLVVLAATCYTGRMRRVVQITLGLVVAVLLGQNGLAIARRGDPTSDADRQIVTALAAAGAPEDLYLVPNGLQELYLRYEFGRPNVLALSLGVGDWQSGCTIIRAAIADTTGAGYHVWLDAGVLDPPTALLQRYRLDGAAVRACFAPFAAQINRDLGVARYAVLAPTPLGAPDWRWRDWTLGWKPNFIRATNWNDGWRFIPTADPHLLSPRLQLHTADWSAVEITMATTLPNQRGQFYWIAPGDSATEARSVSWEIIADGAMHTYTIALRVPTWNGSLGLLRIDPVTSGDGTSTVTVQRLRLVK